MTFWRVFACFLRLFPVFSYLLINVKGQWPLIYWPERIISNLHLSIMNWTELWTPAVKVYKLSTCYYILSKIQVTSKSLNINRETEPGHSNEFSRCGELACKNWNCRSLAPQPRRWKFSRCGELACKNWNCRSLAPQPRRWIGNVFIFPTKRRHSSLPLDQSLETGKHSKGRYIERVILYCLKQSVGWQL